MMQIAKARGIVLEDIPIFAAKTLSQLSFDDTVTHMRRQGDWFASQAPTHKVSILQDAEQGKRLEVEETLGYAVRQATELGVPTPTLDTCYKLIAGINQYLQ
jgi:ketopantoate reductase